MAVRGPEGAAVLDPTATLERLRPIFEDPAVAKLNQNIKYDLLVLRGRGVEVRGVSGDPMVADYLLHSGERSHNLEELARRYLNHPVVPIEDLIGKKSKKQPQLRMDQVPVDKVAAYSGEDADAAWRLCLHLESRLDGPPLRPLYDDVEVPLIEVLAELEYNGIRLDVPLLKRLSGVMAGQLGRIEKEIYELAGRPFNIGSLPQLRKVLFEELKLPVQGKTGVTGAPAPTRNRWRSWPSWTFPEVRCREKSWNSGRSPSSRAPTWTPCRRWSTRTPGASMRRSTRRWRRRGG